MAYRFDYSGSSVGQYVDSEMLFSTNYAGQLLPDTFWTGITSDYVSWYNQDNPPKVEGSPVWVTPDALWRIDSIPFDPAFVLSQVDAPASLVHDPGSLFFGGFSWKPLPESGGSFWKIDGAPGVVQGFDVAPGPYPDYGVAWSAVEQAVTASLIAMQAQFYASLATPLKNITIHHEYWENAASLSAPQTVIDFAPDPKSDMTVGDLFDPEARDYGDERDVLFHRLYTTGRLFGEDDTVEVILSGMDDYFRGGTLRADTLIVRGGDGADTINSFPIFDANGDLSSEHPHPNWIFAYGDKGDDNIDVGALVGAELHGGAGNDFLRVSEAPAGSSIHSLIRGGDGNDTISGALNSANELHGDAGNDVITGGMKADRIFGGAGDDTLNAGSLWTLSGGSTLSTAANYLDGGGGNDRITGGNGNDTILGGAGDDYIQGLGGNDLLVGGAGRDIYDISYAYYGVTQTLPLGDDIIVDNGGVIMFTVSSGFPHTYVSSTDRLAEDQYLRVGNDLILGEYGTASIRIADFYVTPGIWTSAVLHEGGADVDAGIIDFDHARGLANTTWHGTDAGDYMLGSSGNDLISGGPGFDTLIGGDGNDILDGGTNPSNQGDIMLGGAGDDTYYVDSALDLVDEGFVFPDAGWGGTDTIISTANWYWDSQSVGEIVRIAENASDPTGAGVTFVGGIFDNVLYGHSGTDILFGRGGNDTYRAGDGVDWISLSTLGVNDDNAYKGVDGHNTVIVDPRSTGKFSYDIIFEFESGKDKVDVSAYGKQYASGADVLSHAVDDGAGSSYIALGDGLDYLYFVGLSKTELLASDFIV